MGVVGVLGCWVSPRSPGVTNAEPPSIAKFIGLLNINVNGALIKNPYKQKESSIVYS